MIDVLVTGAGGALGSVLMRVLAEAHKTVYGLVSRRGPAPDVGKVLRVDLTDTDSYRDRVFALAPRAIIHLAAVTQVARAWDDPDYARALNVEATVQLLHLADAIGARFIHISTDMVFDGESAPYDERAATEPCSIYGRSKLEAECYVLTHRRTTVLRLPLLYGLPEVSRPPTFFEQIVTALREQTPLRLFEDEIRTPLWLEDAARACAVLAELEHHGVLHAGGPEALSRYAFGLRVAAAISCDPAPLIAVTRADVPSPEPRPRDLSLDSTRFQELLGHPPGRSSVEALPLALARGPHRLLS
jgi:dTDP-4-dehydrorhamnose reductase